MLVKCDTCGKIIPLKDSTSYMAQEGEELDAYYFCSEEHMVQYAKAKGIDLKAEED